MWYFTMRVLTCVVCHVIPLYVFPNICLVNMTVLNMCLLNMCCVNVSYCVVIIETEPQNICDQLIPALSRHYANITPKLSSAPPPQSINIVARISCRTIATETKSISGT